MFAILDNTLWVEIKIEIGIEVNSILNLILRELLVATVSFW